MFFYSYPTKPSDFIASTSWFPKWFVNILPLRGFQDDSNFASCTGNSTPKNRRKTFTFQHPTSFLLFPHKRNWLSGFLDVCWICVCCISSSTFFFRTKKHSLSPPQKKTQEQILTFNMAMWARSHLTFSSFKVLKLIASHRLSTQDPGEKQTKIFRWVFQLKKTMPGVFFFWLLFYPRNLT